MLAIMLAKNDSASHAGKDRISLSCWQRTTQSLMLAKNDSASHAGKELSPRLLPFQISRDIPSSQMSAEGAVPRTCNAPSWMPWRWCPWQRVMRFFGSSSPWWERKMMWWLSSLRR